MKVFDLHCDTLTTAMKKGIDIDDLSLEFSLSHLPPFERYVQTMAVFIPDTLRGDAATRYFVDTADFYTHQRLKFKEQFAPNPGGVETLLSVEGGAVLAGRLENISLLSEYEVRMMTLTWNGPNEIASGALSEGGLTAFGREVISAMEYAGIAADLSHLNDESFFDVMSCITKPPVVSHSNSRQICPNRRNLTDEQFCLIRDSGGIVGLNFHAPFISESPDPTTDELMAHLIHFLELGGENTVALGSDFDGAVMPSFINNASAMDSLYTYVVKSDVGQTLADKLFFGNAAEFFKNNFALPCT